MAPAEQVEEPFERAVRLDPSNDRPVIADVREDDQLRPFAASLRAGTIVEALGKPVQTVDDLAGLLADLREWVRHGNVHPVVSLVVRDRNAKPISLQLLVRET